MIAFPKPLDNGYKRALQLAAALAGIAAVAVSVRPALAQVPPDSGKTGKKAIINKLPVDLTKLRGLDSLVRPPGQGGGTSDGPVPGRTVVFSAPAPCGDADTVEVGGSTDTVEVPSVIGLMENDAHILLGRKRLLHRSREVPLNRTTGIVFAQATPPGTRVAPGTWLRLCWAGPAEVPDVVHLTRAQAVQRLEAAGYGPVEQAVEILQTALVGKVTKQDPPAHARADSGATVAIAVGVLAMVEVPSVAGLSVPAARHKLGASNLWARFTGPTSDSAVVKTQATPAHSRVHAWSRVDLTTVVPAVAVTPTPHPATPSEPSSTVPPKPWLWKVLLALAGMAAAGGIAREIKSPRRLRAIQVVPVRDLGRQTLGTARDDPDAELRRLDLELRPIVDSGVQQVHPDTISAGKEHTGV